jgi:thiol:disulfide interchange protein DsbD
MLLSLLLVLSFVTDTIVVVSNSIDYSPELIEYLEQDFTVIAITADQLPEYSQYQYFIVLGGPDAPEGIGDLVKSVLSKREEKFLRETEEYTMFIRVKDGKSYFVLAGADREQTNLAVTDLKDDVLKYIPKVPLEWLDNFEEAMQNAQSENKLVYINFYTDWCTYCVKMDENAYKDPRIITLLTEDYISVKVNRQYPENAYISSRYKVYVQPVQVVVNPEGEMLWKHIGYLDTEELFAYLTTLLSENPSSAWQNPHNFINI